MYYSVGDAKKCTIGTYVVIVYVCSEAAEFKPLVHNNAKMNLKPFQRVHKSTVQKIRTHLMSNTPLGVQNKLLVNAGGILLAPHEEIVTTKVVSLK